jgi:hypothetical protein
LRAGAWPIKVLDNNKLGAIVGDKPVASIVELPATFNHLKTDA